MPSSLNVSFGKFELSDSTRTIPDQTGKPIRTQQQLEAIAYLQTENLSLSETITIEFVFTIDRNGRFDAIQDEQNDPSDDIVIRPPLLNSSQAKTLVSEILNRWQFEPTQMGGQPVYQSYRAQLVIKPIF
ncbi:hypothetical protein NIES208_13345 [[Limnothrix rosea] IAM M-220]|nr:hypothetical protein NIES208_13345 [[Limnothrix rosea] IAM M-220]